MAHGVDEYIPNYGTYTVQFHIPHYSKWNHECQRKTKRSWPSIASLCSNIATELADWTGSNQSWLKWLRDKFPMLRV